jgi:muramoyltetrapeptide carboxypeptidase
MKHSRPLKKGDTIGIAAPSSPFDKGDFKRGMQMLESLGFNVYHRKDIFDQNRYLAGTDRRRADELMELFQNKNIHAVMFARGGYGSQRIIRLIDPEIIRAHPKPVVGFSDITALLTYLRQTCSVPTMYGPVITMLGKHKEDVTADRLAAALTTEDALGDLPTGDARTYREGSAEGVLVGGCLSLISTSIGTPYELRADGAILFIEEIGEKMYAIDRMLTQLKNTKILDKVRGIVIGSIVPEEGEVYDLEGILGEVLEDFAGPIITDFPCGHTHPFITLPFGITMKMKAASGAKPSLAATGRVFG